MYATRVVATVVFLIACNSAQTPSNRPETGSAPMPNDSSSAPATPPTSTLEQVKRWAPAGKAVGSVATSQVGSSGVDVPGVDLFMVSDPKQPIPADGTLAYQIVAVAGGVGKPIIEGKVEVLRAVIAATSEPMTLARAALLVHDRAGEVLTKAEDDRQRKAQVAPPVARGDAIIFFMRTSGMGRELLRGRLELQSATLELASPPVAQGDAIANAISALAGTNLSLQRTAIATLSAACATDPAARKGLIDAIGKLANDELRGLAAVGAGACGVDAVDTLIRVLEHDKSVLVQSQAAAGLGKIGNAKARPALTKAAASADPGVSWTAKKALESLK